MARKTLTVYAAPRMKGAAPPEAVPFETKIKVSTGARESILWAPIGNRYYFIPLVEEHLDFGYDINNTADGPTITLRRPILVKDLREVYKKGVALTNPEYAKVAALLPKSKPDSARVNFAFLSSTSKMGCWSFNLLAGPPDLGGACPMATPGFLFSPRERQEAARRSMRVPASSIRAEDYLCSGCYALKGKYGESTVLLSQIVRHRVTLRMLRSGIFVDQMSRAISHGRALARKDRAQAGAHLRWACKHPDYFRIHDAGDFFEDTYTRAWLDIIRAFPDVHFWAPTRMLVQRGGASSTFKKHGIPPNLALRPSGLHFGESAPPVVNPGTAAAAVYDEPLPGLAAGSGAVKTDARHQPAKPLGPGEWLCPATLHWTEGGGAQGLLPDTKKVQTPSYTCGLAHGPESPFHGGRTRDETPEGAGCRACWRHKNTAIYYGEH